MNTTGSVNAGDCAALYISGGGVNMLRATFQMMGEPKKGLEILVDHTHTANASVEAGSTASSVSITAPNQRVAIQACVDTIGVLKGQIDGML